ncbi:MAG: FeoB-associated Cys-rich membrane protein [Bacteroidetes bacterium]|nr:FeoB-associated Cys-rich membrane protein [Bacteroidota bacterium]MBU1719201.1 FeoB-associated Cys-rich membrane protein [Bacteroidota bacterium]
MIQEIIATAIIAVAAFFGVRYLIRILGKKKNPCDSCVKDCKSCAMMQNPDFEKK